MLSIVTSVALLFDSCTGGACSRKNSENPTIVDDSQPEAPHPDDILSHPVDFNVRDIDETYRIVTDRNMELSAEQISRAIVVAESGLTRLSHTLEELIRNEDNADTWNVMNELADAQWPWQTRAIVERLDSYELDVAQYTRLMNLREYEDYNLDLVHRLKSRMPNLPNIMVCDL